MTISEAWECLRGDPVPWLLDERRPNLQWKVLTELFRRSPSSPAVIRARGGADAADPVASLVADFDIVGELRPEDRAWKIYSGIGWRLVAAVQWGADPTDPRLQAVARALIESSREGAGSVRRIRKSGNLLLTARLLQALAELGWGRDPWFQEKLAWFEEAISSPAGNPPAECPVISVSVLGAIAASGEQRRKALVDRTLAVLDRVLERWRGKSVPLGHPCLGRTDPAEVLAATARIQAPLSPSLRDGLRRLQRRQLTGGRWPRQISVPTSLPCGPMTPGLGPSRWITLKGVTALMHYGLEADLPRMYPAKPT